LDVGFPTNVRVVPILLIAIVGMIIIVSQSPVAFAGAGIWEDKDNDGYSTQQGDCDDNDPNVYPVDGRCVTTIEIEYDVKDGVVVGSDEQVIISKGAIIEGDIEVNGGIVIITESSTIKGNIVSNGGTIVIKGGAEIDGNVDITVSGTDGVLEIDDATLKGNIMTNGIAIFTVTDSSVDGNIYSENDGDVTITGNTVNGNIDILAPQSCSESSNDVNGNNSYCP